MSVRKRRPSDTPFIQEYYDPSGKEVSKKPTLDSRVTTSVMLRRICGTACALGTAYAFGHFGLSYAWVLLGLSAWAVREYQLQSKRERILSTRAAAVDEKGAVLARLEDLPAWVFFPDTERVEWVNKLLKQFWPFFNDFLTDLIKDTVEPIIKDSLPTYMHSFRFEKIKLGDLPPRVGGVKAYTSKVARNEVILDLELLYAGDCKFEISVKGLRAGLEDLQLHGTLRVVIKPLCKKMPLFGGLYFFFLNPPALDFNLTKMADLLDVPGLSNMLRSTMLDIVCSMVVLPNKYFIPILEGVDNKFVKFVVPAGILRINIAGAKDLVRADVGMLGLGKSDPYTILSVGAQEFKTPYISNTINPKWNYYCEAIVDQLHGQSVRIEVMDHDQGNKDDFLGRATLPIYPLAAKGLADLWVRLEQVETGHLHLECQWLSLSEDPLDFKEAEEEVEKLNAKKFNLSTALLLVFVDAAQNLPDPSRASGEPSPLVILTLANQKKQTNVYKYSSNPIWEESFNFFCRHPQSLSLEAQVVDSKSQKPLGHVSVPLSKVMNETEMKVEETFDLRASGNQSKLTMCLHLKALKPVKLRPEPDKGKSPKSPKKISPTTPSASPGTSPVEKVAPPTSLPWKEAVSDEKDANVPASTGSISPPSLEELVQSTVTPILETADINRDLLSDRKSDELQTSIDSTSLLDSDIQDDLEGRGRIQLTLRYNNQKNRLHVVVHKALDLPRHDEDDPDPYVKLYVLSDKAKDNKHKTQVSKNTCNPVYDEEFDFDGLKQGMVGQSLEVSVVSKNGGSVFARGHILGKVVVPLEGLEPNKPVTEWYTLGPKED